MRLWGRGVATSKPALTTAQALLLVLFCSIVQLGIASVDQEHGHDCSSGCASEWTPVCGSDGTTYGNPCLAICQEQTVAHEGPCTDALSAAWAHAHQGSSDDRLALEHLQRFSNERYRYAARVRLHWPSTEPPSKQTSGRDAEANDPQQQPGRAPDDHDWWRQQRRRTLSESQATPLCPPTPSFVRVTSEGHVYVLTHPDLDVNASSGASAEAQSSQVGSTDPDVGSTTTRPRSGRQLLTVLGSDERVDCPRYPTYPFSAVGMVLTHASSGTSGEYLCSGTLIGPDVVLTAAHCVFSRARNSFLATLDFSPARYRSTYSNDILSPFGSVPWTHVTLYSQFIDPDSLDPMKWDIAVIKLASRVGDSTGWMGIYAPCQAPSPETWSATTAGYPLDRPSGSCVTTQCRVRQDSCDSPYQYHECDTTIGQSGSAMWTMMINPDAQAPRSQRIAPFVRAVHNLEWTRMERDSLGNQFYVPYINSAVAINRYHHQAIMSWIAPSFTPSDPAVKFTSYPLPNTMTSTTKLRVVSGAGGANPTVVVGQAPEDTTSGPSAAPSPVSQPPVAAEVVFWNWTRLLRRSSHR